MITLFNLSRWRTMNHSQEQFDQFRHIEFDPVMAHSDLYVADVTEEESTMLVLLGCDIDHTIATNIDDIRNGKTKMIYKVDNTDEYMIMEVHHATIPFDE